MRFKSTRRHKHHSKNEYGRMMIEKRELQDIHRHKQMSNQSKVKKGNHINRRQYDNLMQRLKRAGDKHMHEKHPH